MCIGKQPLADVFWRALSIPVAVDEHWGPIVALMITFANEYDSIAPSDLIVCSQKKKIVVLAVAKVIQRNTCTEDPEVSTKKSFDHMAFLALQ